MSDQAFRGRKRGQRPDIARVLQFRHAVRWPPWWV